MGEGGDETRHSLGAPSKYAIVSVTSSPRRDERRLKKSNLRLSDKTAESREGEGKTCVVSC